MDAFGSKIVTGLRFYSFKLPYTKLHISSALCFGDIVITNILPVDGFGTRYVFTLSRTHRGEEEEREKNPKGFFRTKEEEFNLGD